MVLTLYKLNYFIYVFLFGMYDSFKSKYAVLMEASRARARETTLYKSAAGMVVECLSQVSTPYDP